MMDVDIVLLSDVPLAWPSFDDGSPTNEFGTSIAILTWTPTQRELAVELRTHERFKGELEGISPRVRTLKKSFTSKNKIGRYRALSGAFYMWTSK